MKYKQAILKAIEKCLYQDYSGGDLDQPHDNNVWELEQAQRLVEELFDLIEGIKLDAQKKYPIEAHAMGKIEAIDKILSSHIKVRR